LFDQYLKYWTVIADKFEGNPNVLGYDIFNDPWPSTWTKKEGENFDRDVLMPLYEEISDIIKSLDQDKVVLFQSSAFPDIIPGEKTPSKIGFESTPQSNSALSQHIYCCDHSPKSCSNKKAYGELYGKK
jgi:endoglycosylceramidase